MVQNTKQSTTSKTSNSRKNSVQHQSNEPKLNRTESVSNQGSTFRIKKENTKSKNDSVLNQSTAIESPEQNQPTPLANNSSQNIFDVRLLGKTHL